MECITHHIKDKHNKIKKIKEDLKYNLLFLFTFFLEHDEMYMRRILIKILISNLVKSESDAEAVAHVLPMLKQ